MKLRTAQPLLPTALLALPLLIFATPALAEESPRTISTSGAATVYVAPDEALIRFSIQTFDRELVKAKELNDAAAEETLNFFKSVNVEEKDVQTGFVASEAVYEQATMKDGRQIRGPITGYTVRRDYSVKLRDITKLSAIYDQLLPDSRVALQGHTLTTSKARKYRDQARTEAAKAAREKAELLAAALDVKVGTPRQISESSNEGYFPMQNNFAMAGDMARGGGSDVSPIGQIEVKAEVNVTFDLVGPK